MSAATMHVCERCGAEFAPHPNKPGRYCSHDCRNEAYKLTVVPAKDTRRGETAAIVKSEMKPIRVKPFSDAEMEAELARIRRQRIDAGLPLIDETMMACGEKQGREQAAMALERVESDAKARNGGYVDSQSLRGKPARLSATEEER